MSQIYQMLALNPTCTISQMDVWFQPHHHPSHSTTIVIIILTFLLFLPSSKPASDYKTLVYKSCASQTFTDPLFSQSYSQTLASLFQQLIAQSSQSKFFKTKELVNDDTVISGLFQCRDDISREDCFTCVNSLPQLSNTLCTDSVSARVQLEGCYTQYETEELPESTGEYSGEESKSSNILLHKDCGESTESYAEFGELMEGAFVALDTEILNSNGYCRTNYKSVQLIAQCEGDLDVCECSKCVSVAVQVVKEECGNSLSAQIYLDGCFLSYVYHTESDGIPRNSVPGNNNNSSSNQKLAAIVVGGAVALVVGLIFVLYLNSRLKKQDYE